LKGQFHLAYANDEGADDGHITEAAQTTGYHPLASPDASSPGVSQEPEPAEQEPVMLDSLSVTLDHSNAPADVPAAAGQRRPSLEQKMSSIMKLVAPPRDGKFAKLTSPVSTREGLGEGNVTPRSTPSFINPKGQVELDRKTSMFMQQLAARKINTAVPGPLQQSRGAAQQHRGLGRPPTAFLNNEGQVSLDRKTSMFMQQLAARKTSNLPQPRGQQPFPQPLAKQNTTGAMQQQQMRHAAHRNRQASGVRMDAPMQQVTTQGSSQTQPREQELPSLKEDDAPEGEEPAMDALI
jgi:hypothetical protein